MKKYISVDAVYNCWKFVKEKNLKVVDDIDAVIVRYYYRYKVREKSRSLKSSVS